MSKKIVQIAVSFLGGVAVGVPIGYLVARKSADEYYAAEAARVINNREEGLREMATAMARTAYGPTPDEEDDQLHPVEEIDDYQSETVDEVEVELGEADEIVSFRDVSVSVEHATAPQIIDPVMDTIWCITHAGYVEESQNLETINLQYFEEDDILVGPNNKPVLDTIRLVGTDALDSRGYGGAPKNMVYVKNTRTESLYAIVFVGGSYTDTITGRPGKRELSRMRDED